MRPIYAEKLKNSYGWWEGNDRQLTRDEVRHYFDAMIDAQPTADAEPVKHGKWVLNERGVYQCECGFVPTMEEKIYYNYCPNCGARMDEENDINENWYSDEYRRIGEDERDEAENET